MNTKKHKSKNRKVHPTPLQKQKQCAATDSKSEVISSVKNIEDVLSPQDINQDESEVIDFSKDEQNVQNLHKGMESTTETVAPSIEESPVKPKRNKGKKKKHNLIESDHDNMKSNDNENKEIIQEACALPEISPNDTAMQENVTVLPSIRKKKNKGKKQIVPPNELSAEGKSDVELLPANQDVLLCKNNDNIIDEFQIEIKAPNKKNKKKKRRHDSEKSDKADEQTCTTALSELINMENIDNSFDHTPAADMEDYKKDTAECIKNPDIILSTVDQCEKDLVEKKDIPQKKKKKEKKQVPKVEDDIQEISTQVRDTKKDESSKSICETVSGGNQKVNEEDNKFKKIFDANTNEEIGIKPKATIAKPVKKIPVQDPDLCVNVIKSAGPTETENKSMDFLNTSNVDSLRASNVKGPLCEEKCQGFAVNLPNIKEDIDNSKNKLETNVQGNIEVEQLNNNTNRGLMQSSQETSSCEMKTREELSNKFSELESDENKLFTEDNPIKDKQSQEDIDKIIFLTENFDNTPDFIQIPRSSSQQMLDDNNNNTVIHEITSMDEMKLGIPVLTSNIVQGSGETPVSTPKIIPTGISVTEIESILNKDQQKTDLKSKMIEVNQDLEELKLSLEKSLAELSAMEDNEENVGNKSYEIVESNKPTTDKTMEKNDMYKPLADRLNEIESKFTPAEIKPTSNICEVQSNSTNIPPICPSRKDRKGKGKSKKKGRQEPESTSTAQSAATTSELKSRETKNESKSEEKTNTSDGKGKQQSSDGKGKQQSTDGNESVKTMSSDVNFEPIENFEDALTSSVEDVDINKTFEIIANELNNDTKIGQPQNEPQMNKPEINVTPPVEEVEEEGKSKYVNPVSEPKNLLGHPNIPVPSSKTDYKKEKNKVPNLKQANVKIRDIDDARPDTALKKSQKSQTDSKIKFGKDSNEIESFTYVTNEKQEYVYKYSFRKVFLASVCHVCRKDLKQTRLPCKFCNLLFYCSQKHKDEDWPRHQSLCFAVSTIVHLKDQKHIYADAKNVSAQNYRLIRMQMILSCEKVLKRKLLPWEQEALLYPRICAEVQCREWRQSKLLDCDGCGQVSYCSEHPEHLPASHKRWCKSYALYQKLVLYQQLNGRLEPKLPAKVMVDEFVIPEKINEVLASMYEEEIDMSDIQYAALTQLATAPLTAAFCHQIYRANNNYSNGMTKKSTFTIHSVGAELQFEADSLSKWEVFLLHLRPDVKDLRVALVGQDLNPSNLPLDLLGNIKLCEMCCSKKRRIQFSFQDKQSYHEYWSSDEFTVPDIVCAFNLNIQRSLTYNGRDAWTATINCIFKQKIPFLITSPTLEELNKDLESIKKYAEASYKTISEPKRNPFASVRPDRNFISDDETPLLFKNYCFSVLCGV